MRLDDKRQVFTFARGVLARLNCTGVRAESMGTFNVHLSHVVGRCVEMDKDVARIAVEEVAWDKDNPIFHILDAQRDFVGPLTITVRMSNILSAQELKGGQQ